ncbi:hypothetical protein CBG46_03950 [Actinobacillus succinogenes]|uniref:Regulator of competence-specific genes n=1 Tax=Actinobacillus succinogenes (strain ATCC 55618 / DSM 22257 / CCUG 43843 / 130Z) TaxID=339671 RepID=A6VL14_ACTSZ|nr:TfoX/Sxy family DNA transformation protein [Actinobacillus succinogenes]ABR73661.1 regulator of competence-specific genes [Actinobacillus succinogenes 130Z]PHI39879.1 hypothetical protein CBG46_03950 [Actinobacillus succinogenes]
MKQQVENKQAENTAVILELLRRLLNSNVISKPLFIGHGIFYDGTMFAIYQKQELYLKADGDLANELLAYGSYPWAYIPRSNMKTGPKYYHISDSIQNDEILYKRLVKLSIKQAKDQKRDIKLIKESSIKYLSNLTVKHERMLAKIGIFTVSEFREKGAIGAYVELIKSGMLLSINVLWKFVCALQNRNVLLLTDKEKEEIGVKLNEALTKEGLRAIKIN